MATDKELIAGLDPYGNLEFAIGSADDFVCFDMAIDYDRQVVALATVVNCETLSFIDTFRPSVVVPFEDAPAVLHDWIDSALEWCAEQPEVRLDLKGWNQDPSFVLRVLRNALLPESARKSRVPRRVRNWRKEL